MAFHQSLNTRLLEARQNGGSLTMAHRLIRRALEKANMKGRQFQDIEELLTAIREFSQVNPDLIRNAA